MGSPERRREGREIWLCSQKGREIRLRSRKGREIRLRSRKGREIRLRFQRARREIWLRFSLHVRPQVWIRLHVPLHVSLRVQEGKEGEEGKVRLRLHVSLHVPLRVQE